jgi:hypothetical protein
VNKGKIKSNKSGHGGNDGWQSNPSESFQLKEPMKAKKKWPHGTLQGPETDRLSWKML